MPSKSHLLVVMISTVVDSSKVTEEVNSHNKKGELLHIQDMLFFTLVCHHNIQADLVANQSPDHLTIRADH